jgi:hypothetical protein
MAKIFSAEKIASIAEEFNREGWVHLPGVLTPNVDLYLDSKKCLPSLGDEL